MDNQDYNNQSKPPMAETPQTIVNEPELPVSSLGSTPAPSPFPTQAPAKKRKGLVLAIIAVVLAVLVGGGVLAYNFWYQNPEKVVTDGMINALRAKTITYTGSVVVTGDTKMKLELEGANSAAAAKLNAKLTFAIEDKDYVLEAYALFDQKGDLYVKAKNLNALAGVYQEALPPESVELVDTLVAKINDQWIKISADDLAMYSEDASEKQKCTSDAIKKYQDDKEAIAEVSNAYAKNKFFIIDKELGSKDGSLGYSIKGDREKAKAFLGDIKNTKIYKSLHECDPSITIDEEKDSEEVSGEDKQEARVELWVERWSHTITKLSATSKEKDTNNQLDILFQPKFDQKVEIAAPDTSITLKQLQADIEELLMSGMTMEEELTAEEAALLSIPELSSEL